MAMPLYAANVKPVGIHFDIEPQSLPEWAASRENVSAQFLDLMAKVVSNWVVFNNNPGSLVFDLPVWLEGITITRNGVTDTVLNFAVKQLPMINWMNFRDNIDALKTSTVEEVNSCQANNKPYTVGLELQNVNYPPITFYEEGVATMKSAMLDMTQFYSAQTPSLFKGMVVHAYRDFALANSSTIPMPTADMPAIVYYWEWNKLVDPVERQAEFTAIKALPLRVTTLLLESETLVLWYQQLLQNILNDAATFGFQIELTSGMARWALPNMHSYVLRVTEATASFIKYGVLGDYNTGLPDDDVPDNISANSGPVIVPKSTTPVVAPPKSTTPVVAPPKSTTPVVAPPKSTTPAVVPPKSTTTPPPLKPQTSSSAPTGSVVVRENTQLAGNAAAGLLPSLFLATVALILGAGAQRIML
ncbi:hypothetical protein, variant 1 [Capsaspora owczarzaki ATCC 30864]|nr:hypothetical protein, variant 1 [Capsaspora owczarzaki ATCC 30864]